MSNSQQKAVWEKHSAQWQRVGVPLRPSVEDGQSMLELAASALPVSARIVVMGVTPEVVKLPWPRGAQLIAFDHSAEMIARVWQPHPVIASSVQMSRWQEMSLPPGSVDLVVGDNPLGVLPEIEDYGEVVREVHRVLKPSGLLVVRMFVRPDVPEPFEAVRQAALAGQVGSFHALKWRVAMAAGLGKDFSVPVRDIRDTFDRLFPDRDALGQRTGWTRETIDTIDAYAGLETRYTFPSLAVLYRACEPWFEPVEVRYGHYELAARCPTIAFRRYEPGKGSGRGQSRVT